MTNDRWGSKWPEIPAGEQLKQTEASTVNYTTDKPWPITGQVICDVDKDGYIDLIPLQDKLLAEWPNEFASGKSILARQAEQGIVEWPNQKAINDKLIDTLTKQGSNLVDEQAYLYFQCEGCNTILDPHTKSFRALQEYRISAGWKCIWNTDGVGYKVYCEKCGGK